MSITVLSKSKSYPQYLEIVSQECGSHHRNILEPAEQMISQHITGTSFSIGLMWALQKFRSRMSRNNSVYWTFVESSIVFDPVGVENPLFSVFGQRFQVLLQIWQMSLIL